MWFIVRLVNDDIDVEYYMGGGYWTRSVHYAKVYDTELANELLTVIPNAYKIKAY